MTKSHRTLEETIFLTQLVARVQFIKIQRRKATHRKIGKLTKVRQHLGSLYLFAQCHSSCSFLLFDIFLSSTDVSDPVWNIIAKSLRSSSLRSPSYLMIEYFNT
ncbi:hypothetical protein A6J86_002000 [Streptococcus mutans]|nr:hypothetical protein A6J86_002000 [Streptococcus mutans]